jgi:uncharacterized protein (TIGR02687 family)
MNISKIQNRILELFKDNRIIFWYDEDKEFLDEVNKFKNQIKNIKTHYLTDSNLIYTKYLLEVEDTENKYLIYAPFLKPNDINNNLADTVYYSKEFHADRISLLISELEIPNEFSDLLKKYKKFWNDQKRVDSFKSIVEKPYTESNIKIAILSSLTNISTPNFDELLKEVLTEDLNNNKYIKTFEKFNILDDFWSFVKLSYSYEDNNPSVEKFLIKLLITYSSIQLDDDIPLGWKKNILESKNNVKVFISNLMNNSTNKNKEFTFEERYNIISNDIARKINLSNSIPKIVETFYNCDAFEIFDKKIIEYFVDILTNNLEYNPEISKIIEDRTIMHFYKKFENEYHMIKWANFLIKNVNQFSNELKPNTVKDIINRYRSNWFFIEKSYRKFYYYYDKVSKFSKLRQVLENMYVNTYLPEITVLFSNAFEGYDSIDIMKQYDFNRKVLRHQKHKTVVIISDALRFGVCEELNDELKKDPNKETELLPMIGVLPSNTKFGMGALLPHKEIEFENGKLIVDGKSTNNLEDRKKILEKYYPNSTAINYDDVKNLNRNQLREDFKEHRLIYIYHNQIDARGDKLATENEVFNACQEAITEIIDLITKLTNDITISNYIITSDHGFIYRRDKLNESDKINLGSDEFLEKSKRYLLSNNKLNINGTKSYSLSFLENDLFITVPNGGDVFKISGSGQNFVHGGASLQEMIIPLLKVHSEKGKKNQRSVNIQLISPINKRITNLNSYLTFAQDEKISNTVNPVEARIFFENSNGERISNEIIIHANRTNDAPQEREFKEKVTMRNNEYKKNENYYLVIENMENSTEINRYEFIIDIAFSDVFDF